MPPLVVTVADSPANVAIRISDQGGGISHADMSKVRSTKNKQQTNTNKSTNKHQQIWDFSFSTATKPNFDEFFTPQMGATLEEQSVKWPIAGTGYGLPFTAP